MVVWTGPPAFPLSWALLEPGYTHGVANFRRVIKKVSNCCVQLDESIGTPCLPTAINFNIAGLCDLSAEQRGYPQRATVGGSVACVRVA